MNVNITKQMKVAFKELKDLIKNTIIFDVENAILNRDGDLEVTFSFDIHADNKVGIKRCLFTKNGNMISDDEVFRGRSNENKN